MFVVDEVSGPLPTRPAQAHYHGQQRDEQGRGSPLQAYEVYVTPNDPQERRCSGGYVGGTDELLHEVPRPHLTPPSSYITYRTVSGRDLSSAAVLFVRASRGDVSR